MDMKNVAVESVFVNVQRVVTSADFTWSICLKILHAGSHVTPIQSD